jgi:hypothetical protein
MKRDRRVFINAEPFARGRLMTRSLRLLILPTLLIEIFCTVSAGSPGDCLSDERVSVQLTGRIIIKES